ncbi:MAG: Sec-independent protein translocase protein TatB [Paracoccaceae bacterium]|nr:Sec-independent protein translocase protein TatB [Paracoccaceae bacterium]
MLNIGWTELMVIGIVALIVIGPKDLPEMFRTLGRFTAKARSMAREFQRAMETAADEAGVKDVAKDLKSMTSGKSLGLDAVKDAASKFESWDPLKQKAAPVAKAAPVIPAPTPESKPAGPATLALIEAQAAKRAARTEAAAAKAVVAAASPPPVVKPARKAAVKTTVATSAKADAPKAVAKPATKKSATKKSDA